MTQVRPSTRAASSSLAKKSAGETNNRYYYRYKLYKPPDLIDARNDENYLIDPVQELL